MDAEFLHKCRLGNIEDAQRMLRNHPNIIRVFDPNNFGPIKDTIMALCVWGKIHTLQWFLSIIPYTYNLLLNVYRLAVDMFYYACINGHIKLARYVLNKYPFVKQSEYFISRAFSRAIDPCICGCYCGASSPSCKFNLIKILKLLLKLNPNIKNDLNLLQESLYWSCIFGSFNRTEFLLQLNPNIDICANNHELFTGACKYNNFEIMKLLQKLRPDVYVINYDKKGNYKDHYIRTEEEAKKEANWQRRKYAVWLASNKCPESSKNDVLFKLPCDVSRYVVGFI